MVDQRPAVLGQAAVVPVRGTRTLTTSESTGRIFCARSGNLSFQLYVQLVLLTDL